MKRLIQRLLLERARGDCRSPCEGRLRTPFWTVLAFGLAACSSTLDPATGDPRLDLQHADPRVRIRAAEQVVRESRVDLCELLVDNLSDRDGAVRLFSSVALRKLTGVDLGFVAHGTAHERGAAVERWRRWLASKRAARGSAAPGPGRAAAADAPDRASPAAGPAPRERDVRKSGAEQRALAPAVPAGAPLEPSTHLPPAGASSRDKKSGEKSDDRWEGTTAEALGN